MNVLSSRIPLHYFATGGVGLPSLLLGTAALLAAAPAPAQVVKGNEAVQTTYSGARQVETPPVPPSVGKPCAAAAACHAGAWHMVETDKGLVECTEPFARPTTCRPSTFGSQKLPRLWIVKTQNTWRWCQFPDTASKCPKMFDRPPANLPYDAVQ